MYNDRTSQTTGSQSYTTCTRMELSKPVRSYPFSIACPMNELAITVGNGGLLVYYQNRGTQDVANGGPGLKAFPPGFRMITGDPARRAKKFPSGEGSPGQSYMHPSARYSPDRNM